MQRTGQENRGDDGREDDLTNQLDPAADAVGFLLRDLQIIIDKPERAEINHAEEGEPDEAVIRSRPERHSKEHRADHEHAAHRRRALFAAVQFGQPMHFVRRADRLADLQRDQFADDEIAEEQARARKR